VLGATPESTDHPIAPAHDDLSISGPGYVGTSPATDPRGDLNR
jgi:hypothetical protein